MQSKIDELAQKGLSKVVSIQKSIEEPYKTLNALTDDLETKFFLNAKHIKDTVRMLHKSQTIFVKLKCFYRVLSKA